MYSTVVYKKQLRPNTQSASQTYAVVCNIQRNCVGSIKVVKRMVNGGFRKNFKYQKIIKIQ